MKQERVEILLVQHSASIQIILQSLKLIKDENELFKEHIKKLDNQFKQNLEKFGKMEELVNNEIKKQLKIEDFKSVYHELQSFKTDMKDIKEELSILKEEIFN